MFIQSIRSIAVVATMTLVCTLFADTLSAQLFGGRGGLFQRNRGGANCCYQVSTCYTTSIASNANQCCQSSSYGNTGYGNAGYGNAGYGNAGYGDSQSSSGYSNQTGQLNNGNAYNQGNADFQNSTQTSGQTGVNYNSTGFGQQRVDGTQWLRTDQNSGANYQTNPQSNLPAPSTTEPSDQFGGQSSELNDGVDVDDNYRSDQDEN